MQSPTFLPRGAFTPKPAYRLLPFRFEQLAGEEYVLTNEVGEYAVLDREVLRALVEHRLQCDTDSYRTLKSRHFLFDDTSDVALELLALKYRTRTSRLPSFTGLHIFVVTLRCDHSCSYCQVSRQAEDRVAFDMRRDHADKALAMVFRSPSPLLKIEFQGGEPLLNFDLIRYVVTRAQELNVVQQRDLQFVIASNLSRLDDEILAFCRDHKIFLSTSLDGPEDLHDRQRKTGGPRSHATTIEAINRARAALGPDSVSALMTTTPDSLARVDHIIDEYARNGFHSIFLRSLSPYGFATRGSLLRRASADDWVDFYRRGLTKVIDLNRKGHAMREEYTAIVLRKMFGQVDAGYVDLQSPAGIAIGALVYNYNGAVYASDEGRMLAEMGDESFRLGHLDADDYEAMMTSERLVSVLLDTMLEGVPRCSDCAFLPYCGADPVFHTATQRDAVGHKAFSAFCRKQMGVLRHIVSLLEHDREARELFMSWV